MGPDDGGAWAERTGPEAARDEKQTEPASALTEEAAEEAAEETAEEAQSASPGQLASQSLPRPRTAGPLTVWLLRQGERQR